MPPLTIEEIQTTDNSVIDRVSRWFDIIDEIVATKPHPTEA